MTTIRTFRRSDREQLTALVNAHVAAVIPGVTVSVNALLNQLEREPGETVVDPWVIERRTLVAVERDAIVAGAHLLRYGDDERVSDSYRNLAELRWLVCRPDASDAGAQLLAEALAQMREWSPRAIGGDGSVPAFGVYGIPGTWPHIRSLYVDGGFAHTGTVEILHSAGVATLASTPARRGLALARSVGRNGTRFSALADGRPIGMIEVETATSGVRFAPESGWADIGNLCVREEHRRSGVARWLLGEAARWLERAGVRQLLAYAWPEQADERAFYAACGFEELVRTERGWLLER